jgi:excisionase family DNA binding protein
MTSQQKKPVNRSNSLTMPFEEVCTTLDIGGSLARKMTRENIIPHIRLGRRVVYPRQAVVDWLNAAAIGADRAGDS